MRPMQQNDVFHAIAHPTRRAILLKLRDGKCAAGQLAEPFEKTFAAISQHLHILEQSGLVSVRREGRHRMYQLCAPPLHDVAGWINEFSTFFNERLDALGDYLDAKHGK
jgi:DNA-binding transcriptional ArsR family regulator